MFVITEQSGKLLSGRVLSETPQSLQVQLTTGKHVKLKQNDVLLRFDTLDAETLLKQAEAIFPTIDLDLLWQCAADEETELQILARTYFGDNATQAQVLAVALQIFAAPHYFQRRSKTQFKKASAETVKAACAALARRELEQQQVQMYAEQMKQGKLPQAIRDVAFELLANPNKNSVAFRALSLVMRMQQKTALCVLSELGALGDASDFHWRQTIEPLLAATPPAPSVFVASAQFDALPLSKVETISIDDSQTDEIDDALSVSTDAQGCLCLGIHIAVPAIMIHDGDALDIYAAQRMSTIYTPTQKITMLPLEVIQSFALTEGKVCPALSLYLYLDENLDVITRESKIERVHIHKNLRYDLLDEQVTAETLNSDALAAALPYGKTLRALWQIALRFQGKREAASAHKDQQAKYDYAINVDDNKQVHIKKRLRGLPLDVIVAEAMIAANTYWGLDLHDAKRAAIYRVQTQTAFGMQTRMTTQAAPHQGLGVAQYAWCTSPLRRWCDLFNQRQLIHWLRADSSSLERQDAGLFARIQQFDQKYTAYAEAQEQLERYWTLVYLKQKHIDTIEALVVREGIARALNLPLYLHCAAISAVERNLVVSLKIIHIDLYTLIVETQLLTVHASTHPTP